MRTIVMGKKVENIYEVKIVKNDEGKWMERPYICSKEIKIEWEEILNYDAEAQSGETLFSCIYLSENEKVQILEQYFRADICCWIQKVDKVLEETSNRSDCEEELIDALKEYNKQKIEDNPKAKAYCDLHKLNYEDTDYDELLGFIEPNDKYDNKSVFISSRSSGKLCTLTANPYIPNYWDEESHNRSSGGSELEF